MDTSKPILENHENVTSAISLALERSKLGGNEIDAKVASVTCATITCWHMEQARLEGCIQVYGQWKRSLENDPCPEDILIFSEVETAIGVLKGRLKAVKDYIEKNYQH